MNLDVDVNKSYLFIIEEQGRRNNVFKNKKFPASVTIAREDTIVDYPVDENGDRKPVIRKIRYCPGEKSIFADEQSENAKTEPIVFINGILRVSGREITKVQYLMNSNYNKGLPDENRQHGKIQYSLFNPTEISEKAVNSQKKSINLKAKILNMPFEDLKHLALATSTSEQMIAQIYRSNEAEIRHFLMSKVDSNKKMFDVNLDDEKLIARVIITRAINEGLLTYNSKSRRIAYASNNTTILQSSLGTDAIKELASLSTENTEYGLVIKELKDKLKIDKVFSSQFEQKVNDVKNEMDNGSVFDKIVKSALKKGIVKKNGSYYIYADKKHNGLNTFIGFLKENPTVFMNLSMELDK